MSKKTTPFGPHLMLEAYNCPPEVLNDANLAYKILDELPEKIGMHKLIKPYVVFAEGNEKKDPGGWSGFVIIQESHVSLHTFIKRRFVTVDVYSCRDFDTDFAIEYFKKMFKTDDVDFVIEQRGKRYPEENID
ncbi:MAG: S-adenosylmethionine decarboxylase [Patescibacteria group bacterium]|jgi:S-adenosylmethionine decarboxylase|nr:S-adenosylmethionine decarboxylase [Patescibacteria group bacterium]